MNFNISQWLLLGQSVFLGLSIIFILMQERGTGLSSAFGGGNEVYLTRRGIEKWVVNLTILSISGFIILRFLSLYLG